MNNRTRLLMSLMFLGLGCGGTMETGTVTRPVNDKPTDDGTCPVGHSLCGKDAFAICVDLQTDPNHCGTCDRACSAGITCQAGICQQIQCKNGTVPLSGPTPATATAQAALGAETTPQQSSLAIKGTPLGKSTDKNTVSLPQGATVADLSGDAWPDRVTWDQVNVGWLISVYLSDAVGTLHLSSSYETGQTYKVIVVDYDGDGRPDIMALGQSVTVYYNRGNGSFSDPVDCGVALGLFDNAFFFADDFNGDGQVDFAFSGTLGHVDVLLGMGNCGFSPIYSYEVAAGSFSLRSLRVVDMNGDGQLDLVAIVGTTDDDLSKPSPAGQSLKDQVVATLLGNPDGTFRQPGNVTSLGTAGISDVAVRDVTGDQRPDVVVSRDDGQTQLWENACR